MARGWREEKIACRPRRGVSLFELMLLQLLQLRWMRFCIRSNGSSFEGLERDHEERAGWHGTGESRIEAAAEADDASLGNQGSPCGSHRGMRISRSLEANFEHVERQCDSGRNSRAHSGADEHGGHLEGVPFAQGGMQSRRVAGRSGGQSAVHTLGHLSQQGMHRTVRAPHHRTQGCIVQQRKPVAWQEKRAQASGNSDESAQEPKRSDDHCGDATNVHTFLFSRSLALSLSPL